MARKVRVSRRQSEARHKAVEGEPTRMQENAEPAVTGQNVSRYAVGTRGTNSGVSRRAKASSPSPKSPAEMAVMGMNANT